MKRISEAIAGNRKAKRRRINEQSGFQFGPQFGDRVIVNHPEPINRESDAYLQGLLAGAPVALPPLHPLFQNEQQAIEAKHLDLPALVPPGLETKRRAKPGAYNRRYKKRQEIKDDNLEYEHIQKSFDKEFRREDKAKKLVHEAAIEKDPARRAQKADKLLRWIAENKRKQAEEEEVRRLTDEMYSKQHTRTKAEIRKQIRDSRNPFNLTEKIAKTAKKFKSDQPRSLPRALRFTDDDIKDVLDFEEEERQQRIAERRRQKRLSTISAKKERKIQNKMRFLQRDLPDDFAVPDPGYTPLAIDEEPAEFRGFVDPGDLAAIAEAEEEEKYSKRRQKKGRYMYELEADYNRWKTKRKNAKLTMARMKEIAEHFLPPIPEELEDHKDQVEFRRQIEQEWKQDRDRDIDMTTLSEPERGEFEARPISGRTRSAFETQPLQMYEDVPISESDLRRVTDYWDMYNWNKDAATGPGKEYEEMLRMQAADQGSTQYPIILPPRPFDPLEVKTFRGQTIEGVVDAYDPEIAQEEREYDDYFTYEDKQRQGKKEEQRLLEGWTGSGYAFGWE